MPKKSERAIKLTKSNVDKLLPESEIYDVPDSEIPGLTIRVHPSGRKVYCLRYRTPAGSMRRFGLGTMGPGVVPDKVRRRASSLLEEVRGGHDPQQVREDKRHGIKFGDFATRYLTEYVDVYHRPTTRYQHRWAVEKYLIPAFSSDALAEITEPQVRGLLAKFKDRPTQANRLRQLLSTMFNKAAEWGEVPEGFNPCAKIRKHREKAVERYLNPEEIFRLFAAIDEEERAGGKKAVERVKAPDEEKLVEAGSRGITPHQAGLFRLLIFTGARLSEVKDAKWSWLNWEASALDLPDSKTGKKRVWLPTPAIEELERLDKLPHGEWIIQNEDRDGPLVNAQKAWQRTRKRAGLEDVRLHDLRHCFASLAVAQNAGLPVIGRALGHRHSATTARYAHLSDDPVKLLVENVGKAITEARAAGAKVKTVTPNTEASKDQKEVDHAQVKEA